MPRRTETVIDERGPSWSRRRFALHGDEVGTWFTERGWAVVRQPPAGSHAFIDELVAPSLTARRIWHTPMTLASSPAPRPAATLHQVSVWLQAEGDLDITDPSGANHSLSTGSAFFFLGQPVFVTSRQPTARIDVTYEHHDLDLARLPHHGDCVDSPTWPALLSIINAVLNTSGSPRPQACALFVTAIESLAKAMWHESTAGTAARPRDVLADATHLIERHASNPSFTVTTLASKLGITRAHLTRVFRERGTPPSRLLKKQRLLVARRLLAHDPRADLSFVAASSGFPSERALRETLRAEGTTRYTTR